MDTTEAADREEIRELVARYNAYGDRGRLDEMMELFAPDGVFEADGHPYQGRDAIRGFMAGAVDTFAVLPAPVLLRHFTATLTIDVTGTSAAEGRCYFLVLLASGLDHWGRYVDTYTRADGVWRFAWRRVVVEGYVPGGWSAEREAHAPGAG